MEQPTRLSKTVTITGEFDDWRVIHRFLTMRGLSYITSSWKYDFSYFNADKKEACSGSIFISAKEITLLFYPLPNERFIDSTDTIIDRVLSVVKKPNVQTRYSHSDYYSEGRLTNDSYFFDMWDMFNGGNEDVDADTSD